MLTCSEFRFEGVLTLTIDEQVEISDLSLKSDLSQKQHPIANLEVVSSAKESKTTRM